MPNILLVWDRMGDYHRARWKAMRETFEGEVFAADLGGNDKLYGWESTEKSTDYFLLSHRSPDRFDWRRLFRFISILSKKKIGVVCVAGYGKPEYVLFILYAWITRRKVILFAESWYPSRLVFDKMKSFFLRLTCDGFLVSGRRAFLHFSERLKVDGIRIKTGYSVVDNDHFKASHEKKAKDRRLLCIARFAPEKNLERLIRAFRNSELSKNDWELCIVGGGPLEDKIRELSIGNNIRLLPWQPYDRLPSLYQQADVFILPSSFEPWGLVVNEAMAAGLPVILSESVGCLPDLLQPGKNGWSFRTHEEDDLAVVLNQVAKSIDSLAEKGKLSTKIVNEYSLRTFAENLKSIIDRR